MAKTMLPLSPFKPAFMPKSSFAACPFSRPSPIPVETCRPSKLSSSIKFTTPEIASDPYTVEAPSFRTSTRLIMISGIPPISTAPSPPTSPITLLEFTKTSVLLKPKPLRSTFLDPSPPLLVDVPS